MSTPNENMADFGTSFHSSASDNETINGATIVAPWAVGRYQVFMLSLDDAAADITWTCHLEVNSGAGAGSWADYSDDDGDQLLSATLTGLGDGAATQQQMLTVDLEALGSTTEYNSIRIVCVVTNGTADSVSCLHYTTGLHNRPGNVTDQWMSQQRTTN